MDITFNNFKCILYSFGEAIARKKDAIFALFEGIFSRRYQQTAPLLNDKEIDLDEPAVAPKAQAVFFEHLLPQHQLLIQLQKKYEKALAHENAGWVKNPLLLDLLELLGCDKEKFLDHPLVYKQMIELLLNLSHKELERLIALSPKEFEKFIESKALSFRCQNANITAKDRVYIQHVSAILDDLKKTGKQEMKKLKEKLPVLTNCSPQVWKELVKSHIYQNLHAFLIRHKQLIAARKPLVDVKEKDKNLLQGYFRIRLHEYYRKYSHDINVSNPIWYNYYSRKITIPLSQKEELQKLGINTDGICYSLSKRQAMNAYQFPDIPLRDREMDVILPSDIAEQDDYMKIHGQTNGVGGAFFRRINEKWFFGFRFQESNFPKDKINAGLQPLEGNFNVGTFGATGHGMFLRLDPKTKNYYLFEPNYGPLAFTTKDEAIECCLQTCRLLYPCTMVQIRRFNLPN